MKCFWSLIPRSLSKNKKRIFFIGVGIILSVSLIVSLSIIIETLKKSSYQSMVDNEGGAYDAFFFTYGKKNLEKLIKDSVVDKISISAYLGTYKIPNSKYTLEINGYDENITELLNLKLLHGIYPENSDEIAIEEWVLDNLPKKYKVGDKINLPITMQYKNKKGKFENLDKEKEFTLVGIFEYKFNTNQKKNTAIAYVPKKYVETILPPEGIEYKGYLTINPNMPIQSGQQLLVVTDDYKDIEFVWNSLKILLLQTYKTINFISIILYIVISIVASVIIYNIFNISVTERIKEFGILRAIGASPGEIKLLVLGEGLILGCIFIPMGIIIGNIVIKGIIILISGYNNFSGIMNIPRNGIIASFLVGFLTIVMGVYSPARKASEISPIEAIISNNNLQLKGKNINNNLQNKSFLSRTFGFAADLAYLNLYRNRKRFLTTVISLCISIIMFLFVNYLINASDPLKTLKVRMGGDFVISTNSEPNYALLDSDVDGIKNIKGIDKINKLKVSQSFMQVPKDKVTFNGLKTIEKESNYTAQTKFDFESGIFKLKTDVLAYTSDDLSIMKQYLLDGNIDKEEMDERPIVILAQNLNYSNNTKLKVGDSIELSYAEYNDDGMNVKNSSEIFTIGALLKEDFSSIDGQSNNVIIMGEKTAEKYLRIKGYQQIKINLSKDANYAEIEKDLKDKMEKHRGSTLVSFKEELEKAKKDNLQFSLIMYSFVVVVAIVSIVNLLNIMSMNVLLRKREIGMLRALGFGNDEVKKMIIIEGMLYGFTAAFWGTAVGTILTYLLYLITRKNLTKGMTWSVPLLTIIVTFLVTIVICLLASINASRKVFSSSIVESIKEL
ncbi:FtsX-like permease family protein [Clostridium estertheticum]|uniref:ABC transporter permease n=1 Tax=Clostridium estertheticum TaxID=238834 RepID=UPI0013E93CA6|nr:FtsX-like permease family protein [Clostridium estertheticum]MBZ9685004.1 FtsX-like permease family protein [Clostridium estertheticum]